MNARAALLLCGLAPAAWGGDLPVIRAIEFAGNEVTRPQVMLREMVVKVGDRADPALIERSRQGVQDLGLFKSVRVDPVPVAGGVRLVFTVVERWYILPIPRLDASTEGESAYGLSLRWFNVDGRNHTLRGNWTQRDEEKVNKEQSTNYGVSYNMPFLFDSPYSVGFGIYHNEAPITDFGGYTETSESVNVGINRAFGAGPASQGWSGGLGLAWSEQNTEGVNAPEPFGQSLSLATSASYRDVRYRIYSEEGVTYGVGAAAAKDGAGSDYGFLSVSGRFTRYYALGATPHQNVNFIAAAGSYHGGPLEYTTSAGVFGLGGASAMRGYPSDFVLGDAYYHLAAEYARPIVWDWLRGLVVFEVGNAFPDAGDFTLEKTYASAGLGLRLRFTFLVNFELEAGMAWALDGAHDGRFFASKV